MSRDVLYGPPIGLAGLAVTRGREEADTDGPAVASSGRQGRNGSAKEPTTSEHSTTGDRGRRQPAATREGLQPRHLAELPMQTILPGAGRSS